VRSSHSQREPAKTRIQTQILTIVSPALYHWPIPLHKVIYVFCCRGLGLHRGVERIDNTVTVPESWAEFTNGNIKRSQAERGASKQMRNDIQSMLNGAGEDLWKQWNKVRRATVYQEIHSNFWFHSNKVYEAHQMVADRTLNIFEISQMHGLVRYQRFLLASNGINN